MINDEKPAGDETPTNEEQAEKPEVRVKSATVKPLLSTHAIERSLLSGYDGNRW